MRNPVVTIFKKELARFFGDRRMALTTILLPGLMIYVLYTFMGSALTSQFSVEDMYRPTAVVENLPDSLTSALSQVLEIQEQSDPMEQVRDQELTCTSVFRRTLTRRWQVMTLPPALPRPRWRFTTTPHPLPPSRRTVSCWRRWTSTRAACPTGLISTAPESMIW